jgi:NAD(P)-dependent dehydrogenase (short-subunit alcohol dehydrogenase family)
MSTQTGCVVVTGASGALGSLVTARLSRDGWKVFPVDRRLADVTDEGQVERVYDQALREHGAVQGSIHCAGGWAPGTAKDGSLQVFEEMMSVNLRSAFVCCRAALRRMDGSGRIVNVAAYGPATSTKLGGSAAYAAAKAGVVALTKAIAETGPARANCVAPDAMRTPKNPPAPGLVPPEDVADAIAYLVSAQAPNGAVLTFPGR